MAVREDSQELETSPLLFDPLFCEEECLDDDLRENGAEEEQTFDVSFDFPKHALFREDDNNELESLISKEDQTLISDESLIIARKEALGWIFRVKAYFGFSTLTIVLAVNYLDRFISSLRYQKDKPWMSQLAAVACLSLAAKVEETQVPLLLDLQVEESKFMFEAKTIQRMELLVLSSLQWKMHPVTPMSFFHHIILRLGLTTHLHREFLLKCERLLLSAISDSRFMCYLPSVLATAIMLYVISEVEPYNHLEYQNQLLSVLKLSKGSVNVCYKLILELLGNDCNNRYGNNKRKNISLPGSPHGVIDAFLSSDTSNDSWTMAPSPSVSLSPEPQLKRSGGLISKCNCLLCFSCLWMC